MELNIDHKLSKMNALFLEMERQVKDLRSIQSITKKLVDQYHEGTLITFDALSQAPLSTELKLAEGITSYRMPVNDKNQIAFVVEFEAGAILKNHYHDCEELIHVLRGELVDATTEEVYEKSIAYPAMIQHELYSPDGALIMVYFDR